MNTKQRRAKAKNRRHEANDLELGPSEPSEVGRAKQEGSQVDQPTRGGVGGARLAQSYEGFGTWLERRVGGGERRVRVVTSVVLGLVIVALGAAVGPWVTGPVSVAAGRIAGAVVAGGIYVSLLGIAAWKPKLGAATAVMAVSLSWAAALALLVALAPNCPGASDPGRCTVEETATYGMIGLLTPLSVALLAAGPILAWRLARFAYRWVSMRIETRREQKAAVARKAAKRERRRSH